MTTLISYNCNTFKILTRFEIKHSSIEDEQNDIYNLRCNIFVQLFSSNIEERCWLGLPHAWVTCWVTNYLLLQIAHSEKLQSTFCPRGLQKKQGLSPTCYATMLLEKLRAGICCLYYRLNATKVANKLKLSRGCHARLHNFPLTYNIYGKELWHNKYYLYTRCLSLITNKT